MRIFNAIAILVLLGLAIISCNKDNSLQEMRDNELRLLDEFINENYPNEEPKRSGLYYIEEIQGSGDTIKGGDRIQVFYATRLIDSTLIDQSSGYVQGHRFEPLEFVVGAGSVISGLDEAVNYMQEGTKAHLVIPSELAYGQNGSGAVGPFNTLLMEVEVYKVYPLELPTPEDD